MKDIPLKIDLTAEDLEAEFGKMISAKALSVFLGIDQRTLVKYHSFWGGVEVFPGHYRFFHQDVKERLNNARINNKTWQKAMACKCNEGRQNIPASIFRRDKEIRTSSVPMGKKQAGRTNVKPDPHGLLDES